MHDVAIQQQTYNGWSNRETWLVNLWLTNDEGSQTILESTAQIDGDLYGRADCLERFIREYYEEQFDDASIWSDLLGTALDRVSWYELAAWASN